MRSSTVERSARVRCLCCLIWELQSAYKSRKGCILMYAIDRVCGRSPCRDMFSCAPPLPQLTCEHPFFHFMLNVTFFLHTKVFWTRSSRGAFARFVPSKVHQTRRIFPEICSWWGIILHSCSVALVSGTPGLILVELLCTYFRYIWQQFYTSI